MPSPFPGMDPFLEAPGLWQDFHLSFIAGLRDALAPAVESRYVVTLDERVDVTYEGITESYMRPDLSVVKSTDDAGVEAPGASVGTVTPVLIPIEMESSWREPFLEVRERRSGELVTAIELLSPGNKAPNSQSRENYLRKRRTLFSSRVHLVELDLLRGGDRMPMLRPMPASAYNVIVSRQERRPTAEVFPVRLSDALPTIPVPLLSPDPDASIDLQAVLRDVYDRARYHLRIDYASTPVPELDKNQAELATRLLRDADGR